MVLMESKSYKEIMIALVKKTVIERQYKNSFGVISQMLIFHLFCRIIYQRTESTHLVEKCVHLGLTDLECIRKVS